MKALKKFILSIITIVLIVSVLSSCTEITFDPTSSTTTKPSGTTDPTTVPTETEEDKTTLKETPDAGNSYTEKIVFLGDSTTYHILKLGPWAYSHYTNVLSGEQNTITLEYVNLDGTRVKVYDTNNVEEYTLMPVSEAIGYKKPEILIITLGINGCKYLSEDYFKAIYSQLIRNIKAASPNTIIVLDSIFPVTQMCSDGSIRDYYNSIYGFNPDGTPVKAEGEWYNVIPIEKVQTANRWIYDLAKENGLYYLDSYSALSNKDGFLPDELCVGDGEHLTAQAYEILFQYIRTHAVPGYTND